jgi:hypothetical protein
MTGLTFQLALKHPSRMGSGERRSKLLDPTSPLYKFVDYLRDRLKAYMAANNAKASPKRIDYHVEVLDEREAREAATAMRRTLRIHNRELAVTIKSFYINERVVSLNVGDVGDEGRKKQGHVTIVYSSAGLPDKASLRKVVQEALAAYGKAMP